MDNSYKNYAKQFDLFGCSRAGFGAKALQTDYAQIYVIRLICPQ